MTNISNREVVLSVDSACDLSEELIKKYKISSQPFYIHLDGKQYRDGVDIFPDDIYKIYHEKKILPKTASISIGDYKEYFKKLKCQNRDIVHLNLSSGISSTYNNCCIATKEVGGVYPVDSHNLSTAIGILAIKAGRMIAKGFDALHVQKELELMSKNLKSSFVIETLDFLKSGGRCSSLASIGAKIFNIKPCIVVNDEGKMVVGKKYRGQFKDVVSRYADDVLKNMKNADKDQIFITHAGALDEYINIVYQKAKEINYFDNIYVKRAGCTISSHCGPNTIGIMYLSK